MGEPSTRSRGASKKRGAPSNSHLFTFYNGKRTDSLRPEPVENSDSEQDLFVVSDEEVEQTDSKPASTSSRKKRKISNGPSTPRVATPRSVKNKKLNLEGDGEESFGVRRSTRNSPIPVTRTKRAVRPSLKPEVETAAEIEMDESEEEIEVVVVKPSKRKNTPRKSAVRASKRKLPTKNIDTFQIEIEEMHLEKSVKVVKEVDSPVEVVEVVEVVEMGLFGRITRFFGF